MFRVLRVGGQLDTFCPGNGMDRLRLAGGVEQQYIELLCAQRHLQCGIEPGSREHPIVQGMADHDQQVDIATSLAVIGSRAE